MSCLNELLFLSYPLTFCGRMIEIANNACYHIARSPHERGHLDIMHVAKKVLSDNIHALTHFAGESFSAFKEAFHTATAPFFSDEEIDAFDGQNPWDLNFRDVTENRDLLTSKKTSWLEKFVKVDINDHLPIGKIIEVPTDQGFETYRVHQKFSKQGLVAYALVPAQENSSLKPMITFRCTEVNPFKEQAIHSVHNDLGAHIGEKGWLANKAEFQTLMNDPSFRKEGEKIEVAGYSLGGAHAQYFIEEHYKDVAIGTFYSAPSIDSKVAESFKEKAKEITEDDSLTLQIFRTLGDPCHHFGEKQLGWGVDLPNVSVQVLEIEYPNQSIFSIDLHARRIFDTERFDYRVHEHTSPEKLDLLLDNSNRDPISKCLEKARKITSFALAALLSYLCFYPANPKQETL